MTGLTPFRFLTSFHFHAKTDLQALVDLRNGPCQIFADSGAFSAVTVGATISFPEYAAWLKHWDQLITVKATLDVIGDHKATMRNTRRLEDTGLRVLPVFHVGTPWTELEKLCAEYSYVALGGMVPHTNNPTAVMRWLVRCFQVGREHGTVFHGFGQLRLDILKVLPFYSADSSAWGANIRYGWSVLWDQPHRRMQKVTLGSAVDARRHAALLRGHGLDPVAFGDPGFARRAARSQETYHAEYSALLQSAASAYRRMEQWLVTRHRVSPPQGWDSPGPCLYLAEGSDLHLAAVARALGEPKDPINNRTMMEAL